MPSSQKVISARYINFYTYYILSIAKAHKNSCAFVQYIAKVPYIHFCDKLFEGRTQQTLLLHVKMTVD